MLLRCLRKSETERAKGKKGTRTESDIKSPSREDAVRRNRRKARFMSYGGQFSRKCLRKPSQSTRMRTCQEVR
jgi:hypothetical protein